MTSPTEPSAPHPVPRTGSAPSCGTSPNAGYGNTGTNPGTVVIGAPVRWIELTIAVQVASAALAE